MGLVPRNRMLASAVSIHRMRWLAKKNHPHGIRHARVRR